jgi:uncharacterized membrane protein YphA (DoxX/SURF4 family)
MAMSIVVLVGRILFASLFLQSAIGHLTQTTPMAGYAKSKGVPQAWLATFVGGILLLLGGVSVLLGIWGDLGALLLAVFLVPTALFMHAFWREQGQSRQMEMIQFNKDLALAGAAIALLGLFAIAGHKLGLTITGPLFKIH